MKRLLFVVLFLNIYSFIFCENVEFRASAPQTIGVDQNFSLQYSVNKQGSLSLGDLNDFRIVGGPSTSTSTSVNIINNNVTQTVTYTYTYTLQAKKTGTFTIPPATINIGGERFMSNDVKIQVVDHPVSTGRRQRQHDPWDNFFRDQHSDRQQQQQQEPQEIKPEDLFVRVHVDKSSLYRGEHLIATIKLYTKVDIAGFEEFVTPLFNGFWTEEIEMSGRINLEREVINGQVYNVGIIKKYVLFPRHSGKLRIEPCELKCQIRQVVRGGGRSLIDQFFGQQQIITKSIKSPELIINVKDLPHNNSHHFKGAVGSYNLSTNISRDTLLVNEAVNIQIKISGNGNLRMLNHPDIFFPKEFEVYDPEIYNNFSARTTGISGSRTWDFTIIPRYPGIFDLGQVVFEFFDTKTKKYKKLKSDNIIIAVKKDKHDKDFAQTVFNYNQRSVDYIGEGDIRFIRIGNLNLNRSNVPLITKWEFRVLYISSVLLFLAFVVTRRQKIKENANIALVKNKRANKVSRRRMKLARKFMQDNDNSKFYKEVINAIWGYLGDKLVIEPAYLTRDKVIEQLKNKNIDDLTTEKLLNIIDKCEYAHFSPTNQETKMTVIYEEAIEIIKTLEQKLNKN